VFKMTTGQTIKEKMERRIQKAAADFEVRPEIVIEPYLGRWRAHAVDHGTQTFVWETDDKQECVRMAELYLRECDFRKAWKSPLAGKVEREISPGFKVVAEPKGPFGISLELWCNGKNVGGLGFELTKWPGSYVIGRPTIDGGGALHGYTRRGFGTAMYDIAEELLGLPVVPHGVNGVRGTQSRDALRFWEKRKSDRQVPGTDLLASERSSEWDKASKLMKAEMRGSSLHNECGFIANVANIMGWNVGGYCPDNGDRVPKFGVWCVTPEGSAFSARGTFQGSDRVAQMWTEEGFVPVDGAILIEEDGVAFFQRAQRDFGYKLDYPGVFEDIQIILERHKIDIPTEKIENTKPEPPPASHSQR
jgi:hypothetical protein